MSEQTKLYVAGIGMITPVGANTAMTAAAVKAGISGYQLSNNINKNSDNMQMALVPEESLPILNPELEQNNTITARQKRMLRLSTPALHELMSKVKLKNPPPLFLALPESIPGYQQNIGKDFIEFMSIQSGIKFDKSNSKILSTGRAGGFQAVDLAIKYLSVASNEVVIVGGIDTYQDLKLLGLLDLEDRILADGIMDGFVPGEAAGFLMLISENVSNNLNNKFKKIYSTGIGREKGHRYSTETFTGEGLSTAFNLALQNSDDALIDVIYSSLNGEHLGAKELGVATLRNKKRFTENIKIEHPADCFGDLGAAFGPVLVGLSCMDNNKNSLCYCSSENDLRSAVKVCR